MQWQADEDGELAANNSVDSGLEELEYKNCDMEEAEDSETDYDNMSNRYVLYRYC